MTRPISVVLFTLAVLTCAPAAFASDGLVGSDRIISSERQAAAAARSVSVSAQPGTRMEEKRYAAREAASPEARNYRGGDVLVISASAVAVVLLVVLIILLI